jgi:hypothetical protein
MFATIGHTFELMKTSWRVLMKDRELILFPIMSGVVLLVVAGIFLAIAASTGSLDRLDAATQAGSSEEAQAGDIVLGVSLYVIGYFVVIFFNAALIAAALERLRGGDPNVGSGLRAASAHIPQIIGWAVIAATVGLLLQLARSRTDNFLGRIAISLVGGVWAYMTFFVVPALVAEGIGPIEAIKRSGSLFRGTWGRQFTASFGFGLVYIVAVLIAFIPAALVFVIAPVAGIVLGVFTMAIAIGTVQALEGVFKAALYEFANGETPAEFDRNDLQGAYRAL